MDRPLIEVLGAVLHELRRSGPLGLHVEELQARIASPLVSSAIGALADEGRVVVRGDLVRRSAAELMIEELRGALASAEARLAAALSPEIEGGPGRPHAALGARLNSLATACGLQEIEARGGTNRDAYIAGLCDASWIASYGGAAPSIEIARLMLGDGSTIRCVVLGLIGDGRWLLSAPGVGRVRVDADGLGEPSGVRCRMHGEDLARLRAKAEG